MVRFHQFYNQFIAGNFSQKHQMVYPSNANDFYAYWNVEYANEFNYFFIFLQANFVAAQYKVRLPPHYIGLVMTAVSCTTQFYSPDFFSFLLISLLQARFPEDDIKFIFISMDRSLQELYNHDDVLRTFEFVKIRELVPVAKVAEIPLFLN